MSLISELRRRQVFRAAAWYAAAAWVVIQVASTVIPQFGLPEWSVRAVIVAAVLGFPVALGLAWLFDLSALGLRRESNASVTSDGSATQAPTAPLWRIPSFWMALALGAGLAVSAQQAWRRIVRPAFGERPGLAVLPFANLSPDPANAYFADGLHEEILATLARISGLRVISRTSVQQFRDTKRNLRDIGDALDVALILEGSVRREGDDVRLTLQLIDGRTDAHLWAETYDRKFENALHLQRSVAQQIVAAIGAKLTPTEDRLIELAAPSVPEAYTYYLQALSRWNPMAAESELRTAEGLLTRALELDSKFALGYALRARVRVWLGTTTEGPGIEADVQGAWLDIERALDLQLDLPEALAARASYITYVEREPARALADLDKALELAPNDADTHDIAGLTKRRLGRFDEAIAHFREAARLMPAEPQHSMRIFQTLGGLGRYAEAERERQSFAQRFPSWRSAAELGGFRMRFLAAGDTDGWREAFERLAPGLPPYLRAYQFTHLSRATGDLAGYAAFLEEADPSEVERATDRAVELARTYAALEDLARARPYLVSVVDEMARSPNGRSLSDGAVALILLGRPDEAVSAVEEASRLTPEARDAVNGPTVAVTRAWVLIRAGGERADEGYAELQRLLGAFRVQPRSFAVYSLGVLLREDERAQRIIREAIERQDRARAAAGHADE
jgi:TolB-like protein/Flp pilus assembly protein TadD